MPLTIFPSKGLQGTITVPGDKSISHRTAMLAALTDGTSRLTGWLPAGDCLATIEALRALGVPIEVERTTETAATVTVQGVGLHGLSVPAKALNCHGSGTTMRLLAGLLAGQPFSSVLDGHEGLRRRPMERVARPLRQMGATVATRDGYPPIYVDGGNLHGIEYRMPIPSGQVKSAILLAGLFANGTTTIHQPGPARDHTEVLLRSLGVPLETDGTTITIHPPENPLPAMDIAIPADFSSAAFPLVAAVLIPNSELRITGVNINPTRTGLLDVLTEMGAAVQIENQTDMAGEPVGDLVAKSSTLRGTEVSGDTVVRMIDEFPIFAVAATQAKGRTVVRDAAELRVKESDRIKATVDELRKLGAQMIAHPDGFEVYGPTPLHAAVVDSYGDHRLAMALAVAGLLADGETTIRNARVIADSYPGFVSMLKNLGVEVVA